VVTVFENPTSNLPMDTTFCEGSILTLTLDQPGQWSTGEMAASVQLTTPGTYNVLLTNGPCAVTDNFTVYMTLLPVVNLGEDTSICEWSPLILSAEADQHVQYVWSTGDTTASITVNTANYYDVTAFNSCGKASDMIWVDTYLCDWNLFIPNAFTPNEDFKNEGWKVEGYNITNFKLHIYNRFGDVVFYSDDISQAWKPSIGIGDDIYNYRIEALTFDNEWIARTGHIYLLR
jgi:gliding motility-associated-like protein